MPQLNPQKAKLLSVLIVDDNVDAASAMAMFLEQMGYSVTAVHHPNDAMLAVEELAFDFFLVDIGLPDMDGYELVKELKQKVLNHNAIFAAYTAYGDEAYRQKSLACGFTYHFVKTSDVVGIVSALEQTHERTQAGRSI